MHDLYEIMLITFSFNITHQKLSLVVPVLTNKQCRGNCGGLKIIP